MKKIILFITVFFILNNSLKSQTKFGIKAGFNFSSLKGDGASNFSTLIAPNFGSFANFKINQTINLQPELMFSFEGTKAAAGAGITEKIYVNYLNLPVLIDFNAGSGFNLLTGPQLGILLSSKAKISSSLLASTTNSYDNRITSNSTSSNQTLVAATSTSEQTVDLTGQIKTLGLSWVLGVAYNIPKMPLNLGLRYNLGLTNISTQSNVKNHLNVFQLGVGYTFKK